MSSLLKERREGGREEEKRKIVYEARVSPHSGQEREFHLGRGALQRPNPEASLEVAVVESA